MNIRSHIATAGLKTLIEGNYGLPVHLTDPDGITTEHVGQILYDSDGINPETGDLMVVKETTATLRKTALSRIPLASETWKVAIPINPAVPNTLKTFLMSSDRAPIDGQSNGWIKLFLQEAEQI